MFVNLKEVIWGSKILLSKEREEQSKNCFVDEKVDFKYVENEFDDEFDNLLEHIQKRKPRCNENNLGADYNREHICYCNRNKKDKTFNSFLAVRK